MAEIRRVHVMESLLRNNDSAARALREHLAGGALVEAGRAGEAVGLLGDRVEPVHFVRVLERVATVDL